MAQPHGTETEVDVVVVVVIGFVDPTTTTTMQFPKYFTSRVFDTSEHILITICKIGENVSPSTFASDLLIYY